MAEANKVGERLVMNTDEFLASLERVPWFERVGLPASRDPEVFRIYSWETWPGPADPGSELQALYYHKWRDDLFQPAAPSWLTTLWETIHSTTLAAAQQKVPYDPAQDTWYGPNAAVWSASFVAALAGCTLAKHGYLGAATPACLQWTLAQEWSWYVEGHWPC